MPDNGSQLGDKLTRLAESVLDDLLVEGIDGLKKPLDQRIDGLKAVGTLYLGLKKHYKEPESDEGVGASFNVMRERVKAAEGAGK